MTDDGATFTFDGVPMRARRGWTVGAALLANGVAAWRTTRVAGRPRGLFCGIGACFDCLVDSGDDAVRACLVPVRDGDEVRTCASVAAGEHAPVEPGVPTAAAAVSTDVAVVGAGPAGMAAALAAADLGCRVTVIDAAPAVGGQIYRQPLVDGQGRADPNAAAPDPAQPVPHRLRRVARHPRIRLLLSTTVWHAAAQAGSDADRGSSQRAVVRNDPRSPRAVPGFVLRLTNPTGRGTAPGRPGTLHAHAVVLATGATEIVPPFPGWDLPGVTTAGAAQALLKSHGVLVGRRVLVAGSGPLLLPAAAGLAVAGAQVVAVLEATSARAVVRSAPGLTRHPGKLTEAARYLAVLAGHRVPVRTGHAVVACHGTDRVRRATVARVDPAGRPVAGTAHDVPVDAVHVSVGFSPALELSRLLGCADVPHPNRPTASVRHDEDFATSVPGVFAAGEITGIGGADVAELEGYLAGASAARHLGGVDAATAAARTGRIRARLARAHRFAVLLDALYPAVPGWLDRPEPDTIVCRCEDVPQRAISDAVAAGARDVRAVKGVTRCGMGYCQGRVCGPIVQQAVAAATGRPLSEVGDLHARPLLTPVSVGTIAATFPSSVAGHGSGRAGQRFTG